MIEITTVIALKSFPRKLGHFYDNFQHWVKCSDNRGVRIIGVRIIDVVLY